MQADAEILFLGLQISHTLHKGLTPTEGWSLVGLASLPKAGSHTFSCGDSLPVWACNLEDRNVRVSSLKMAGPAHQNLKGTLLPGQSLSGGVPGKDWSADEWSQKFGIGV